MDAPDAMTGIFPRRKQMRRSGQGASTGKPAGSEDPKDVEEYRATRG